MTTTQTDQAAIDALIQAAVAPLQAKLDGYEASQETAAVEARIAEAVADRQTEIDELQTKLDAADAKVNVAEQKNSDYETWLTAEKARLDGEAEVASRKDARRAAVAELNCYKPEQIDEKLDRWAAQDDETFAATLADLAELAPATAGTDTQLGGDKKVSTAMNNTRQTDEGKTLNPVQALMEQQSGEKRINLRNLI